MEEKLQELIAAQADDMIARRRDFHKYPEAAWTEFRTASLVAETLSSLGYRVETGQEVIAPEDMMGLPAPQAVEYHIRRALQQGANSQWVAKMSGGENRCGRYDVIFSARADCGPPF